MKNYKIQVSFSLKFFAINSNLYFSFFTFHFSFNYQKISLFQEIF